MIPCTRARTGARCTMSLTCIRDGTTLEAAGRRLEANGERHIRAPERDGAPVPCLPRGAPETQRLLERIGFSLGDLKYEYPHEPVPERLGTTGLA